VITRLRVLCAVIGIAGLAATACNLGRTKTDPGGARDLLAVSDETGGQLVLIDPTSGTVVDRIAVGKRPRGVKVIAASGRAIVALSGSPIAGPHAEARTLPPADRAADGLGLIDLSSRRVLRTLASGRDPESFDLSNDGRIAYVSNEETAELSAVDLETGTVTGRVNVGSEPEGVQVRPDGKIVYVTCEGDGAVYALATEPFRVVAQIPSGLRPRAIAFTADGQTAFVSDENDASVVVIDAAAHKPVGLIRVPPTAGTKTPPRPMDLKLSADGRQLFVSLGRAGSVAILDPALRRVITVIERVGERPWGLAVSSDGQWLYTANGPSGDVSVISVAAQRVVRRIRTGGSPWGVAVVH